MVMVGRHSFSFVDVSNTLLCTTKSSEMIMEAVTDETAIVSLQVQGKSGTNRKAKAKSGNQTGESKRVDLPTLRLRFATKILTQLRFMQASFRDLDGKISQFYTENAEIKDKTNLKSQGVPESRLISDTPCSWETMQHSFG